MVEHTPFEIVVQKLIDLGFYDFFFPFVITAVILFALLKKSRVIGDSSAINGVVSISVAMLILGFPVLTGVTFGSELSTFFVQTSIFMLIFVVGFILASIFYPDLGKFMAEHLKSRTFIYIMLALGISIFVISGMLTVFINPANPVITGQEPETPAPPTDIVIIIAALIIFMILIIIAAAVFRRSG